MGDLFLPARNTAIFGTGFADYVPKARFASGWNSFEEGWFDVRSQ